jgi:hypothetical protein
MTFAPIEPCGHAERDTRRPAVPTEEVTPTHPQQLDYDRLRGTEDDSLRLF